MWLDQKQKMTYARSLRALIKETLDTLSDDEVIEMGESISGILTRSIDFDNVNQMSLNMLM
jgi:hypothetical protein